MELLSFTTAPRVDAQASADRTGVGGWLPHIRPDATNVCLANTADNGNQSHNDADEEFQRSTSSFNNLMVSSKKSQCSGPSPAQPAIKSTAQPSRDGLV